MLTTGQKVAVKRRPNSGCHLLFCIAKLVWITLCTIKLRSGISSATIGKRIRRHIHRASRIDHTVLVFIEELTRERTLIGNANTV
jgi:hypothetical protein